MVKFKRGQKVKCIESSFMSGVTAGKIYTVRSCNELYVSVLDDSGTVGQWFVTRFVDVGTTSKSKSWKNGQAVRTIKGFQQVPAGRKGTILKRSYAGAGYLVQLKHAVHGTRDYRIPGEFLKGLKGRPVKAERLSKMRKR